MGLVRPLRGLNSGPVGSVQSELVQTEPWTVYLQAFVSLQCPDHPIRPVPFALVLIPEAIQHGDMAAHLQHFWSPSISHLLAIHACDMKKRWAGVKVGAQAVLMH